MGTKVYRQIYISGFLSSIELYFVRKSYKALEKSIAEEDEEYKDQILATISKTKYFNKFDVSELQQ